MFIVRFLVKGESLLMKLSTENRKAIRDTIQKEYKCKQADIVIMSITKI